MLLCSRSQICWSFEAYSKISIQTLTLKTVILNSRALNCHCFFLLQKKIWAFRDHGKPTIWIELPTKSILVLGMRSILFSFNLVKDNKYLNLSDFQSQSKNQWHKKNHWKKIEEKRMHFITRAHPEEKLKSREHLRAHAAEEPIH